MKQSSDLTFRPFDKDDFDMFAGAVPFCPNTKGAEPLICPDEENSCFYLIDRRGYTVVFVLDGHGTELEEWFIEHKWFGDDEGLAYWPRTPQQAAKCDWLKR